MLCCAALCCDHKVHAPTGTVPSGTRLTHTECVAACADMRCAALFRWSWACCADPQHSSVWQTANALASATPVAAHGVGLQPRAA